MSSILLSRFHSLSWVDTKEMYASWMRWKEGRQKTSYFGKLLFLWPWLIPFHIVLLKFPTGSCIPPHKDKVKGKIHYRLNIVIWPAKKGGIFKTVGSIFQSKYVNFFRSDLCQHEVTKVEEGTRYVLSVGWVFRLAN